MAKTLGSASGASVASRFIQVQKKIREGWAAGLYDNEKGTPATKAAKRTANGDESPSTGPAKKKARATKKTVETTKAKTTKPKVKTTIKAVPTSE